MGRGRRLSTPTRIFLGFAVVLVSFATLATLSTLRHAETAVELRRLHRDHLPIAVELVRAETDASVLGAVLDGAGTRLDVATRSWLAAARRIRPGRLLELSRRLEHALSADPPEDDRRLFVELAAQVGAVRREVGAVEARYDALLRALDAPGSPDHGELARELRLAERSIERRLRSARRALEGRIASLGADAAATERRTALGLGVLTAIALLVGVLVTWDAARRLAPLAQLVTRVQRIARGELDARLVPARDDELGHLAAEIERMVDALVQRDQRLREEHEARLRLQRMQAQILADLRAAVVVVDAQGRVRLTNPAAARVLELGPDAVGRLLTETDLVARLAPLEEAVRSVVAGADRSMLSAVRFGQGERLVDVLVTPLGGRSGTEGADAEQPAVLIVAEDVTEALRTKARLIQTERLAAIGRMAAHVTHEVRNPLTSIGLNVEMLEEEMREAGPEVRALIGAIQREIDRLTAITEEYLRLARLPTPHLGLESPASLIAEVAAFVRREMTAAGVDLEIDIDPDVPPVAVDEGQMRQALVNLLRNAREASRPGDRVVVQARRAPGGGALLRVLDEGPGVPAGDRERIFDLFYTTKEGGTGLGLPLTQQIVAAHGGAIRCLEGPAGRGATFEIELPPASSEGLAVSRRERVLDA
ncbi:MAG: ATP-binding protein [Myxococcota bacterium]|nr:ATP-binding protein [Myxococcota bacterium]MDW8363349.1 ATP-binding protein [Myxococcales bacterium]